MAGIHTHTHPNHKLTLNLEQVMHLLIDSRQWWIDAGFSCALYILINSDPCWFSLKNMLEQSLAKIRKTHSINADNSKTNAKTINNE